MEFLLLKIQKKELIALLAIKSFIHQSALNVGNQSALNLVKRNSIQNAFTVGTLE